MLCDDALAVDALVGFVDALLARLGVRPEIARITSESLVDADARGIGTHGVVRLPIYVERLRRGLVNPRPEARWSEVGGSAHRLDGDRGFGQWIGALATERACALARAQGIGVVVAVRSNHFGAAGWFARRACAAGCAAIVLSQAESMVVPFGGTQRLSGTNPLCLAVPRPGGEPLLLDMATSIVPFGRIELAKRRGERIPPTWGVDADGAPTTDPHRVHALQPMAGPKGSGLALLIDLLSGGLAGAACGPRIRRLYGDFAAPHDLAHTVIAIDAERFAGAGALAAAVERAVADLRGQRPAEGHAEVLAPGEPEARAAARSRDEGIALEPSLRAELARLGDEHGVRFPA